MSFVEKLPLSARKAVIGGSLTALTGLTALGLGGSVLAQATPTVETPQTEAATTISPSSVDVLYGAFVDRLATNLNVADAASVDTAIRTTLKQLVDDQLAAGAITEEEATLLRQRIDESVAPIRLASARSYHDDRVDLDRDGDGPRDGRSDRRGDGLDDDLDVETDELATFLGITPDQLRDELQQGLSLGQIAENHGRSRAELEAFLRTSVEDDIDALIDGDAAASDETDTTAPSTPVGTDALASPTPVV